MLHFCSIDDVSSELTGSALAIGNFDGVHLGHKQLIKKILLLKKNSLACILTFSPHPLEIFKPHSNLFRLTPDKQKLKFFSELGVDSVITQKSDEKFLSLSANDFVTQILVKKLNVAHVVVGSDFVFGKDRVGDISLLKSMGKEFGFKVHIIEPVLLDNTRCSSSSIRTFLSNGHVLKANSMLGRKYSVTGMVEHGDKIGRKLGFRTANVSVPKNFAMKHGIYATVTRVSFDNKHVDYLSATSLGTRPSVSDKCETLLETHCLNQSLDLYGKSIEIFFVDFIRDEICFSTLEELKEQMKQDCITVEKMNQENPCLFEIISQP